MEIVIVICLFMVIILLVSEKIVIKKITYKKESSSELDLPEIMGKPMPVKSHSLPNTANERQIQEPEVNSYNLEIEYDENEDINIQIPQEELDEVFSNTPDLEEEEEEWNRYGMSGSDNGYAQGVTFEELSSVGMLLQKENLEPAQKEKAVDIVQRLQGTELFSLLESSMEGTSRRIAELLDSTLSSETETSSSTLRKNDLNDFDIGEFV
ncbi:MAG TPA: hypothetical protein VLY84_06115 [Dysgonamonadaceae bacterium]|nr:hypothetical protein [Dysgonamonadaceae bacterium]